jgi:hypothetical protein
MILKRVETLLLNDYPNIVLLNYFTTLFYNIDSKIELIVMRSINCNLSTKKKTIFTEH